MLTKENFTIEHIERVRESRKVDKTILERSIYALGLLEALVTVGMKFIFKGGTSLTLLLDSPKRLSTDIDIIVSPGTDVKEYIEEASRIFPFKSYTEQIRTGRDKIEKRHYQFVYDSPAFGDAFYILLDILFEENHYSRLVQKPINNSLVITDEPTQIVTMPSVDCILGDKLTAFAPHTTGIPFNIDKELEIIKQMYDISCLFDVFEDFADVKESYYSTSKAEIAYRGANISPEEALKDTITSAMCIASRGKIGDDYPLLLNGIKKIATHIFDDSFNAELAILRACKVMYIATCVLYNTEPIKIDNPELYHNVNISKSKYNKLSKLRNSEPLGFAYIVESLKMIERDLF